MSLRDYNWKPEVGEWVVYDPKHGPREDGTVTAVVDAARVRVLYRGDTTAKLTYIRDLSRGAPADEGEDWLTPEGYDDSPDQGVHRFDGGGFW